jgi:hypothetical protein
VSSEVVAGLSLVLSQTPGSPGRRMGDWVFSVKLNSPESVNVTGRFRESLGTFELESVTLVIDSV